MANLTVIFACGLYDRMLPLYTGVVKPEGIDLRFLAIDDPRAVFTRMSKGEFDVAEMSSSEHISRMSAGDSRFVALPVFPSRTFRHGFIYINRRSCIERPKDLEGKRIGVSVYSQTAAVFIRGLLQHDHGVNLSTLRWIEGGMNVASAHASQAILPLFKPALVEANTSGKSLSDLLAAGDIDAISGALVPHSFGRHPDVQRLFSNLRETEKEYYRRTRIFPIMHLIAVRRELYERHPFIAASLYNAFCGAKRQALGRMREVGALAYMLPWLAYDIDEIEEVFGIDAWPYGVEPNRPTLEALVRYMSEQGLIENPMPIDDLFVPVEA